MTGDGVRRTFAAVPPCLLILAFVSSVWAEDGGDILAPAEAPFVVTAEQRLEAARRSYVDGLTEEARSRLRELLSEGRNLPDAVRHDALAYLGDILFSEEGASAADPFFRALLDEAPRYVMDPLQHPDEVARHFESLRPRPPLMDVVAVRPPAKAPEPPPWLALSPGGVYYFAQGKPGTGAAIAASQATLLVANLILIGQLRDQGGVHPDTGEEAAWRALELASNLTAGAFYLSLLLPPAIEFGGWDIARRSVARVAIAPGAVTVTGTF